MNKIFADRSRIFLDSWNAAYGNKILHLLFLINLCSRHGRAPIMYRGSNLENIFDFKMTLLESARSASVPRYLYEEKDPFSKDGWVYSLLGLKKRVADTDLTSILLKYFFNHLEQKHLLERAELPDDDLMINGHFFDYALMPSAQTFGKFMNPKGHLVTSLLEKYPTLTEEHSVAVHLRGTDFSTHLRKIFREGIGLDDDYYRNAVDIMEKIKGKDVEYHLFSDDMPRLESIFAGKRYIIHDDSAHLDWVALYLAKNIIQSNSSFCWTAALYNKDQSIQPACGYNYHGGIGSIPFGFAHEGSILVANRRAVSFGRERYSADARFHEAGILDVISNATGHSVTSSVRIIKRIRTKWAR